MHRKTLSVFLVVVLVAGALPFGTGIAAAAEEPHFQTYVPEPRLVPGEDQTVTLQLVNDRQDASISVRDATNVRATVKSGSTDIEVLSGTQFLGRMGEGNVTPLQVRISVPADIEGDTYRLPIRIEYEDDGQTRTDLEYAELTVDRRARFEISETKTVVPVGGEGTIRLTMKNVGERDASAASVSIESTSEDVVFGQRASASRFVGEWEEDQSKTLEYDVRVTEDAAERPYMLTARVVYEDEDGKELSSREFRFGVTPLPEQQFLVENLESTLRVGQEGTLRGSIVNTGSLTATNAVVVFKPSGGSVSAADSEYAAGTIEPDDSAAFSFDVAVDSSADAGPRQFTLQVKYRNEQGDQLVSRDIDVRTTVGPQRPDFVIENVSSTLRVGSEGTFEGAVRYRGDEPVSSAVVLFQSDSPTVTPIETEYALGRFRPGQTKQFAFDTEISSSADAGPRQFSFAVRYRNPDNVLQTSSTLDVRTRVKPDTPEFDVEGLQTNVTRGNGGELRLRVTNNREETFTDISAKIYTESPLSSSDQEAFVERLEPGDSETLVFDISAGGSALTKTYPVKLDFQYDDQDGDTIISDTYQVPVRVTESSGGGGLPLPILGGVALLLIVGGGWFYYRRR